MLIKVGCLYFKNVYTPLALEVPLASWRGVLALQASFGRARGEAGGEAGVLPQELLHDEYSVLKLQLLTLHVVLAQLHLQQVVAHGQASTDGHIHIFIYISQQSLNRLDGFHLLLKRDELQSADILTHLGETVAVDDLTSSEDGLDSRHASYGAVFHHRDTDRAA